MVGKSNSRMKLFKRLAALPTQAKHALINWTQADDPLRLDSQNGWFNMPGRRQGRNVNDRQVMTLTASFRSVKLITETVGSLPLHLMERTDDVPKKAKAHPLYDRLHYKANDLQTSAAFIEQIVMSLCLWNQAYIRLRGVGSYAQYYAVSAAFVTPKVIDNGFDVVYEVLEPNGKRVQLSRNEIIPVDGFRWPGALKGMAIAGMLRESFSLAMAAEDFGAKYFNGGGRPSGVISTDQMLTIPQRDQIREKYASLIGNGGLDDMGGIHVLEAGFKYTPISSSPDDAQFLGTRKYSVAEIARIFGVPLHLLAELDRATYANAEQNNREFLTYTLLPYLRRIESAFNAFALSDSDRKKYFAKFSVEGLLRADSAGRAAFYREGRVGGWLTQNEIRALEDLPRFEGADELHVPLNMAPVGELTDILKPEKEDSKK